VVADHEDYGEISRKRNRFRDRLELWLGKESPLTTSGIYKMIKRRGKLAGVEVHPTHSGTPLPTSGSTPAATSTT
jgi:hypothetical protein